MLILMVCLCPGGGMADAEDLKSSGDFSSCGFDSHPGHHSEGPLIASRRVASSWQVDSSVFSRQRCVFIVGKHWNGFASRADQDQFDIRWLQGATNHLSHPQAHGFQTLVPFPGGKHQHELSARLYAVDTVEQIPVGSIRKIFFTKKKSNRTARENFMCL